MAKRSHSRKPLSEAERARGRYVLIVIGLTTVSVAGLLLLVWTLRRPLPLPNEDHPHILGMHGGAVVSGGEGNHHLHAEAVMEKRGFLSVYTYGEDAASVLEIESQLVSARVRAVGEAESVVMDLLPIPQAGDSPGKTSRFGGKLPKAMRGFPLEVIVPEIAINGKAIRLEFPPPASHNSSREPIGDDPERLPLIPGGKYTEADVRANGNRTVGERYATLHSVHEFKPRSGDRVCPVTHARVDPTCAWTVAGQVYLFCCPPCVEEFLWTVREHPGDIKDATDYVHH